MIAGIDLPASLSQLTFGRDFRLPIVGIRWLTPLEELMLGENFNHPIEDVEWPAL